MSDKWNSEYRTVKINKQLHEMLYRLRDAYRMQTRRNITADELLERLIAQDSLILNLYKRI